MNILRIVNPKEKLWQSFTKLKKKYRETMTDYKDMQASRDRYRDLYISLQTALKETEKGTENEVSDERSVAGSVAGSVVEGLTQSGSRVVIMIKSLLCRIKVISIS